MVSLTLISRPTLSYYFYVSRCRISQSHVDEMLPPIRENNESLKITGRLIYTGNYFVQHLEGPSSAISDKVALIKQDVRHDNFTRLAGGPIVQRKFGQLDMGFVVKPSLDKYIEPLMYWLLDDELIAQSRELLFDEMSDFPRVPELFTRSS